MTHILIPREPSAALLRPFIGCNTQELPEAWAAMVRIAEVQHARAGSQCLAQPVLYVSPGQLANHSNPEGPESEKAGRYLPARVTPGGKFTQPLYAGAAPAAVAGPAARKVFLVATGETSDGAETYTRHDDAPPPLCDAECLYTAPAAPALEAPATPADEHAAFQADYLRWCPGKQGRLGRDGAGDRSGYSHAMVQARWLGWSARAALAAAPQAPAAPTKPFAYVVRWAGILPDEKPIILWPNQIAAHEDGMRAAGQTISPLYEGAAPAAPAVDAFTHAELLEIQRAVEEFADCNETDVDYALLLRAAQAGYLECTQFHVLNQSALDLDTVAAGQTKDGGDQ